MMRGWGAKDKSFKIDVCKQKQISGYMNICWQLILPP